MKILNETYIYNIYWISLFALAADVDVDGDGR
jgi:hypothetical protein